MILLSPYLNLPILNSDSLLQHTKNLHCFWLMFMNGKWVTYSWPEVISLGYSNTLSAVVIILMELSINFMASKIFLWQANMLTYLLSRPIVDSKVMGGFYICCSWMWYLLRVQLFSWVASGSSFLRCHQTKSWLHHSWCHSLGSRWVFIVLFVTFIRRFLCFFLVMLGGSVPLDVFTFLVMVISIIVGLLVGAAIV